MAAILAAQPAVAEVKLLKCPNAEAVSAGCKNFEQTGLTWMYELNVAADKDKRIVKLVVPVSANVGLEMTSTDNLQNVYTTIEEQRREYAYRPIADNQASFVAFTIWATDSTKFKKGQASIGYAQGEAALVHSDVEAPKPLPNGIRIMFGVGNSFKLDDSAEFAITDDGKTLVLEQDSKNRAEGYIGALFKLKEIGKAKRRRLDALVSLQFGEGERGALNGFLFGLGYQINPSLSIVGGYSLRRGQELSPGFRAAASQFITEQKQSSDPNVARDFERFELNDDSLMFDGLPLNRPGSEGRFFPGRPIINSFNSAFSIGIAIPLDLVGVFKNK